MRKSRELLCSWFRFSDGVAGMQSCPGDVRKIREAATAPDAPQPAKLGDNGIGAARPVCMNWCS